MKFSKKFFFCTCLFLFIFLAADAQNKLGDSLIQQYEAGNVKGDELPVLKTIIENTNNPQKLQKYSEILIKKAKVVSNISYLKSGYLQKGNALQLKGDYADALKAYFKSRKYALADNDDVGIGAVTISIADTYAMIENFETADKYYKEGIGILRKTGDSIRMATSLLNAGDSAYKAGFYPEALVYLEESQEIFKKKNHRIGMAYAIGNIGMVYAEQGKDDLAKNNMNQSIEMLQEQDQFYPISVFLNIISDIYAKQDEMELAITYAKKSLDLAKRYNLKDQISEANLQLSKLYKQENNFEKAYNYYTDHISFRDSLTNLGAVQEMARIRTENEIARKQVEIDLMEQQRKTQRILAIAAAIALVFIIIIAIGLYRRNQFINKTRKIIENERNRSDRLLLNILPEETAQELKDVGKVRSKRFDLVSVLFADIVGFTRITEKFTPEDLVKKIDNYFSKFDEIMEKYSLEKIKTMGDCYMCAGGLPFPSKDHTVNIILAGVEMIAYMKEMRMQNDELANFYLRVGVNSGPVVAGVVGSKKFSYDIWGDTVNIASRMESSSEKDRINVSENTYELIKNNFECQYRGEIEVKYKGIMKMYFVQDLKENFKIHKNEKVPHRKSSQY
ncbi:MAG: adenylate/guanylate cyclase domain-containing protein [Christiangramia sp.]